MRIQKDLMNVTGDIQQIRDIRWQDPALTWGLVPTMGYLHEGHLSLVRRALAENDRVMVTIYVNPTQFAPTEDLSTYPRDLERDLALLQEVGAHVVFTPDDAAHVPKRFSDLCLCGKSDQSVGRGIAPHAFSGGGHHRGETVQHCPAHPRLFWTKGLSANGRSAPNGV